jgi:hypothetical protein
MAGDIENRSPRSVMAVGQVNLLAGWIGILCGVLSGSCIGLFFHKEDWAGGYDSFRRRMLRLGHISFFGLGIVNLVFGLSVETGSLSSPSLNIIAVSFIIGAFTMPLFCYLTAWRRPFRHFFPIPVLSIALGLILVLAGW